MSAWQMAAAVPAHAQRLADTLPVPVDAVELLTGRAGLLALPPPGRISAGGATRLLPARDGWFALTLSRADDVAAVPALLEVDDTDDPWSAITGWAATRGAVEIVCRARLLGLPAAVLGETPSTAPVVRPVGRPSSPRPWADLLVVELASMWAGPLCGRLLAQAGATVVKVESPGRPDGPRAGAPAFFDWMNSDKWSYAVDLADPRLREVLAVADVVIEGSRPAALTGRGLGPDASPGPDGRVWARITGHGAAWARADWVAFGDDAAVAGGLVADGPAFAGDAIADPLTGLQAAVAITDAVGRGGGQVIELSMAGVAATYATLPATGVVDLVPRTPRVAGRAAALGRDNAAVDDMVERRRTAC